MAFALSFLAQQTAGPWPPASPDWTRALLAVAFVLALAVACAWLLRRGSFGPIGRRRQRVLTAETVALLGDRRSLVVVTVEGRRLLLGVTPASVSLVTELAGAAAFDGTLDALAQPPTGPVS